MPSPKKPAPRPIGSKAPKKPVVKDKTPTKPVAKAKTQIPLSDWNWSTLSNVVSRIDRNVTSLSNFFKAADWSNLLQTAARIDKNVTALTPTLLKVEKDMSAIDDAVATLTTQVTANTSAEQGAVTLIQELAGLITTNANDPDAINALADKLKSSADALAAAITANTPAPAPAPA